MSSQAHRRIAWARRLLAPLAPALCAGCGRTASRVEPLCSRCRTELRWLGPERVQASGIDLWAPVAYEGPAQSLVAALKYRGATTMADTMAAQIAASAPPGVLIAGAARVVLVPVPLHPARLRRRGYNQADLLASALAERTGLGVASCLVRSGPAVTQVGRDRPQRARAIEGAVRAPSGALVPAHALLIDDVVTTGATLAACAAALLGAGAIEVEAVAYARTPGR